jgi:hypothetical protein
MTSLDAITVFQSLDHRPINKIVERSVDGTITKRMAKNGGRFRACPVPVATPADLANVLRDICAQPDITISLSLFRDPPTNKLTVLPMVELAEKLGVDPCDRAALVGYHELDGVCTTARIKENMVQGSWLLFDRDQVGDMPSRAGQLELR